jgi:hypothetical protein
MFSAHVEGEIRAAALARGVDGCAVLAVAEVGGDGAALAAIGGRPMPPIRFEAHLFHRRLPHSARPAAIGAGLAAARPGQIAQPRSQAERHAMFARAALIDREAACAACLWGVGRAPGEAARLMGLDGAEAVAEVAISGVAGQVALLLRLAEARGALRALRDGDWPAFAALYGAGQPGALDDPAALARAHAGWRDRPASGPAPAPLALGSSGAAVARLQRDLAALGAALAADGLFGPRTRAAVRAFQAGAGLVRDGVAGPATLARLDEALGRAPPPRPQRPPETSITAPLA